MQQPVRIAPSILSADFAKLGEEVRAIDCSRGRLHPYRRDGRPFRAQPHHRAEPWSKRCARIPKLIFDTHLMIAPVDPFIADFAAAGSDIITVHPEAGPHLHRTHPAHQIARQKSRRRAQPGDADRACRICAERYRSRAGDERQSRLRRAELHSRGAREIACAARPHRQAWPQDRPRSGWRHQRGHGTRRDRRRRRCPGRGHRDLRRRRQRLCRQYSSPARPSRAPGKSGGGSSP